MLASWLNIPHSDRERPWLTVTSRHVAAVIFCRSRGYHNDPREMWRRIHAAYARRAVFVGLPEEHDAFCREVGPVRYYPTRDFLEFAQVLAGAELVCCNQSSPRAVAEGLKVPVLVETCDPKNTHFGRSKAWYFDGESGQLPPIMLAEDDWSI